jgi:hypothetical protein
MVKNCLKLAILLTIIVATPIFVLRALPYSDRAVAALIQENCPAPCFMRIRPGMTTMQEAVYYLQSHPWVANGRDGFSSQVRSAVFYDAGLPRTIIDVRWTEGAPQWIDGTQRGAVLVEDRDVLDIAVGTHLSLGEIVLAFGDPDESWFLASNSPSGRRFEYIAWYETERMLVSAEGLCPTRRYYTFPVRIRFRPASPGHSESASKASVCR